MDIPEALGIIAGNGVYPRLLADAARRAGVKRLVAAAFTDETDDRLAAMVDEIHWMRVGQLGKLIACFRAAGVTNAIMAGQIAPKNLFDLRPDWKTLLLLARLKRRNAESIFAAIGDELARSNIELLPATSFLEDCLAPEGLIAGRKLTRREEDDVAFGFEIAREISRLDIGQTVIVKNGTVLAVEGFEGTNEAIKRGGLLGGRNATMVKVAKPKQDMRFDVPVIGVATVGVATEAHLRVIAIEAGRTLLLEKDALVESAARSNISIVAR
ncbi:MAG TPA: UDP-2,3-diacylglucosamine diphosphatase LpxI [Chthoniobacterales bacterium]|nr:UDP-2,3-diacylglucosamine diphosphatase LpxI [Chthoniobacterales bacterium]